MSKLSSFVNSATFAKDMKYLASEYGYDPYNSLDALEDMLFEEAEVMDAPYVEDDMYYTPGDLVHSCICTEFEEDTFGLAPH
jgi:hypothetical protein